MPDLHPALLILHCNTASIRKSYITDIQLNPVGIHIIVDLRRGKHIDRAVCKLFRCKLERYKFDLIVESVLQYTAGVALPQRAQQNRAITAIINGFLKRSAKALSFVSISGIL